METELGYLWGSLYPMWLLFHPPTHFPLSGVPIPTGHGGQPVFEVCG